MTEKERMLKGKIYDPSDEELTTIRLKAHRLCKEYNGLLETDERRDEIIIELFEETAESSLKTEQENKTQKRTSRFM